MASYVTKSLPDTGDEVKVWVWMLPSGDPVVKRDGSEKPLKLLGDGVTVPNQAGTYEIRGTANKVIRAESGGADFLSLIDVTVERVSRDHADLPPDAQSPSGPAYEQSSVDVDVESVLNESESIHTKKQRPSTTLGPSDGRLKDYNQLLLE